MLIPSRLRPSLLALVFGLTTLLAGVHGTPPSVAAAGSLPDCRYDDVLTQHRAYRDWDTTVLDTIYALPKRYHPPGLVSTRRAGLNAGGKVRRFVIPDLAALARAARRAGAALRVVSAYRTYSYQEELLEREIGNKGERRARLTVARPGHSEHQLGVTVDFGSARNAWSYSDWAKTPAGSWMKRNAWKYGFVMSYPKGKRSVTCYRYEPWHYRYIGRNLAAKVRRSGLTLREFLWRHFE